MSGPAPIIQIHEVHPGTRGPLRTEWVRLRHALWESGLQELEQQLQQLADRGVPYVGFLACKADGAAIAFAEAALRPYVNGCESSPVAFLEGIYVEPACRSQGLARTLVQKVARWGRMAGCTEFASDARIENSDSHAMHLALGFTETSRVVYFRKPLA